MKPFKPMLAATVEDVNALRFPLLASPKLDGVRAVVIGGIVLSRSLKPIPNKHVQSLFGRHELNGLDGELICGDPCRAAAFRDTTSAVMKAAGEPDVKFYVFDCFTSPQDTFTARISNFPGVCHDDLECVPQTLIRSAAELEAFESNCLGAGYEGVMLRRTDAPYKFGRGTLREGCLMKLKRFADGEARVVGFEEQMHNANKAARDALGNIKRSARRDGLAGKNTLGALIVEDAATGVKFNIGSGMDDATRQRIWDERADYVGRLVKYKYFPGGGKDKPRFPTFLGVRAEFDK